jgi:hypothetical protein
MPAKEILKEAKTLHNVGDRLNVLADKNPPVEDALNVISGNVHDTANLLKVVVATKLGIPPIPIPRLTELLIRWWLRPYENRARHHLGRESQPIQAQISQFNE